MVNGCGVGSSAARSQDSLSCVQHEGDDGGASRLPCGDCSLIEGRGELFRRRVNGGSLDLIGCSGLKTKLADAIAFPGGDRRSKNAAGLRTRGVEIAGAMLGVKRGAGLVIAEILKTGNWIATFVEFEGAGGRIAGKMRGEARPGGGRTLLNAGRALRVFTPEGGGRTRWRISTWRSRKQSTLELACSR